LEFSEGINNLLQFLEGAKTAMDEHWQAEAGSRHELEQLADDWCP
jgi:hypothetical protein